MQVIEVEHMVQVESGPWNCVVSAPATFAIAIFVQDLGNLAETPNQKRLQHIAKFSATVDVGPIVVGNTIDQRFDKTSVLILVTASGRTTVGMVGEVLLVSIDPYQILQRPRDSCLGVALQFRQVEDEIRRQNGICNEIFVSFLVMVFAHDTRIIHGHAKSIELVLYFRKQTLLSKVDQCVATWIPTSRRLTFEACHSVIPLVKDGLSQIQNGKSNSRKSFPVVIDQFDDPVSSQELVELTTLQRRVRYFYRALAIKR